MPTVVGLVTEALCGLMLLGTGGVGGMAASGASASLSSGSLNELRRRVLLIVSMTFWKCFWSLRILVGRLIEIVAFSSLVAFTDTLGNSLFPSVIASLALGGRVNPSFVFSGVNMTHPWSEGSTSTFVVKGLTGYERPVGGVTGYELATEGVEE